jgi:hypothetical protein
MTGGSVYAGGDDDEEVSFSRWATWEQYLNADLNRMPSLISMKFKIMASFINSIVPSVADLARR